MYDKHGEAGAPPRHEHQWVLVAVVSEVGEDGVVPNEVQVSQRLVVLLRDQLQRRVRHQHVVAVQVQPLQGQAGLQDPDEVGVLHLLGHDVDPQVGAHADLNGERKFLSFVASVKNTGRKSVFLPSSSSRCLSASFLVTSSPGRGR